MKAKTKALYLTATEIRRPNKQARGYHATANRRKKLTDKGWISNPKHPAYDAIKENKHLKLSLYGNFDILNNRQLGKRTLKHHPTDIGYTKPVYVLSDKGKRILKKYLDK